MATMQWVIAVAFSLLCLEVLSQKDEQFVKAANCFSINLMNELETPDGNLIMSGLSVENVLNMLALGARGSTADELNEVLQNTANGLSSEDVKRTSRSTMQRLTTNQKVTMDVANAIYIDQSFTINQDYKKTVEEAFLAKADNADFKNKAHEVTEAINNWVDEKTRSQIKKLFDKDLDPSTAMVLLNAIYFKGDWLHKFDAAATKTQRFYNGDDRDAKATVPLMNTVGEFSYKDEESMKVQVLRMDYKGEKISFVVALPYREFKMKNFERLLNCQTISNLLDVPETIAVNVTLPKLDMNSDLKLVQPLKDLGLKKIFDGGDLSGIGPGALKVTEVVQKAKIKMDEEGSQASAATGAVVSFGAAVKPRREALFRADHPFYFFIVEKSSGLILFQGKVKGF